MKRFGVRIRLLDDTVFTERAGTVGAPKGLDYVPGSALLGVAAARLYPSWSPSASWTVFHSGAVRFGCAFPMAGSEPAYPAPLAWHSRKATDPSKHKSPLAEVENALVAGFAAGTQMKQVRGGYVTAQGRFTTVGLPVTMMTAIDPATRRAAEEQLFSYQVLPQDTELFASIESDDTIPDALWTELRGVFNGEIRLGRSRSAFGTARAEVVDGVNGLTHGNVDDRTIVVWLLSDLAALTPEGNPTTTPMPHWLGLPKGQLDLSRSFIRTRRYSPWNAKRRGPDLERVVISQGSVLSFVLDAVSDGVISTVEAGLGLYRQCGLGRAVVNPALLGRQRPALHEEGSTVAATELADQPTRYHADLLAWIEGRKRATNAAEASQSSAEEFARALENAYLQTRKLNAAPGDVAVGPSPSQLGTLFQIARDGRGEWAQPVFAAINGNAEGWSVEVAPSKSFADWFRDELGNRVAKKDWRTLQSCLRRAMDVAAKEYAR